MKLISYVHGGRQTWGHLTSDGVIELASTQASTLRKALAEGGVEGVLARAAQGAGQPVSLDEVTLLPPIPEPEKILCVGLNYRAHAAETGAELPARPSLFARFPNAQVGHDQPVLKPFVSDAFDFEGELAVVIGRACRHLQPCEALAHVAGYSCFSDNSVRDFQRHSTQATAGKNFEQSGGFGPWLVTSDEIPDPSILTLTTRLNGQTVQQTPLSDLIFDVAALIAYASTFTRLEPGDVIATGTPSGVGAARRPPLWMKPGDVLEVDIPGVGLLRNPVVAERRAAL